MLAPNHVTFLDSFFLPLVVRRRVTFVAKAEYFDSWKTSWFFRACGQIPMRREGGSASERALAAARQVLESGGVLGIYPEGTRSPDGRLYRGHTGVARLALGCRGPVVPVGLVGTTEVQRPGSNMPRPFKRVAVRFGAPVDVSRYEAQAADDPSRWRVHRRADVRDPRTHRTGVRRSLCQAPRCGGRVGGGGRGALAARRGQTDAATPAPAGGGRLTLVAQAEDSAAHKAR